MNSIIELTEGVVTVCIPGLVAIRIDPDSRVIAVDNVSGDTFSDLYPEWTIKDLRDHEMGDFSSLRLTRVDGRSAQRIADDLTILSHTD